MFLAYIVDNNVFTNDEFPDAMMAGIMIIYCVCSMIVPGIAAHFVYEKAKRSWIIWICPLVLMLTCGLSHCLRNALDIANTASP